MQLTKDQLRALPEELRRYDGLAPDGATPITVQQFHALQRRALGIAEPEPKRKRTPRAATDTLLNEISWLLSWAATRRPNRADADRMAQLQAVVERTYKEREEFKERMRD